MSAKASVETSFKSSKSVAIFLAVPKAYVETEFEVLFEEYGTVMNCCLEVAQTRLFERSLVASRKAYYLAHHATGDVLVDHAMLDALTAAYFNGCPAAQFETEIRDMLQSSWKSGRSHYLRNAKGRRK